MSASFGQAVRYLFDCMLPVVNSIIYNDLLMHKPVDGENGVMLVLLVLEFYAGLQQRIVLKG